MCYNDDRRFFRHFINHLDEVFFMEHVDGGGRFIHNGNGLITQVTPQQVNNLTLTAA